ncbi:MAG: tyrosine-type recombinase/integrase [Solobacterium sp.]|nr:tyrosine-type recombinase/integrase [Solobacterium sp.]
MDFAVQLRDDTLLKMRAGYSVSHFKTVYELYEKTFELFPVRIKTKKKHDIFYRTAIVPYGDKEINKITSADIQESLNKYAETHTKQQTIQLLAVWRRIFKACAFLNINIVDRTVAVIVPKGIQGNPRSKDISMKDLDIFCDALLEYNAASVSGQYYSRSIYYAIQIMRYCGLRPAETFALKKTDINMLFGTIDITKAIRSTTDSIQQLGETKTAQFVRRVPIPEGLKPILTECLTWSKFDILLTDYHGNLMNIDEVCTLIGNVRQRIQKTQGIKIDFTLYQLLHQFSTDLMTQGIAPNVVRDLMGHASASMSLDYAASKEIDRSKAINERHFS